MSTFAPVYRPTKGQQTFLSLEQKREARKRKRDNEDEESQESSREQSPDFNSSPYQARAFAPVNKTDPYRVAGLSRQHALPRYPFPHAPVKPADAPRRSSQEELAAVKPPLYLPKTEAEEQSSSLKRRHLDNLTTILHRCMLKGDWERASRVWGLLVRTEVGGLGIDVRQHGRWGIGAEILMRHERSKAHDNSVKSTRRKSDDDSSSIHGASDDIKQQQTSPQLSDEGFKLAREYYERLVLQYPYTPHTQHTVNSKVFYPALFNIWVYEVQARHKHVRDEASLARRSSVQSMGSDNASEHSSPRGPSNTYDLATRELQDATPIVDRLDQLLLSPPYDVSEPLLQLRGMVGLWLSDLYLLLAKARKSRSEDGLASSPSAPGPSDYADRVSTAQNRQKASAERKRAKELFAKVKALGSDISAEYDFDLDAVEDMSE